MNIIIQTLLFSVIIAFSGCNEQRATYYYQKAYDLEEQEKFEEAIFHLDKAIELNPSFEQAYLDRAIDKSILGDLEGAIADLTVLIDLNPKATEPYVWRAEYLRKLSRFEEALVDIDSALNKKQLIFRDSLIAGVVELDYDNPLIPNENFNIGLKYILYERGASNFHLGNFEQAWYDLKNCENQGLITKDTKYYLGITLMALGFKSEGCASLSEAKRLGSKEAKLVIQEDCLNAIEN